MTELCTICASPCNDDPHTLNLCDECKRKLGGDSNEKR
jgi:hypothetical protein